MPPRRPTSVSVFLGALLLLAGGCSDPAGPLDAGPSADGGADSDTSSEPDSGADAGDASGDSGDGGGIGDTGTGDAGVDPGWGVLSLNLHCLDTDGTRFGDNGARFGAIADGAVRNGARVLLLQEVCDDGDTVALTVLKDALERESGQTWYGAFAFAHVAWEGTPREADEGVAILADVPLEDVQTISHGTESGLRRVMLSAALGDALDNVDVTTFHLDHADDAARRVQARELATAGLVYSGSANAILGGDLNAREGSVAYGDVLASGYQDASTPLRATRIDHIFVHRGARVGATEATLLFDAPDQRVSDHPGVLVRVAERAPTPAPLTTLEIEVDAGLGNHVFVRGDQAPLDWTRGWPALNRGPNLWTFATTELEGAFEYKALRNDADWSTGENLLGGAGDAHRVSVAFE